MMSDRAFRDLIRATADEVRSWPYSKRLEAVEAGYLDRRFLGTKDDDDE